MVLALFRGWDIVPDFGYIIPVAERGAFLHKLRVSLGGLRLWLL